MLASHRVVPLTPLALVRFRLTCGSGLTPASRSFLACLVGSRLPAVGARLLSLRPRVPPPSSRALRFLLRHCFRPLPHPFGSVVSSSRCLPARPRLGDSVGAGAVVIRSFSGWGRVIPSVGCLASLRRCRLSASCPHCVSSSLLGSYRVRPASCLLSALLVSCPVPPRRPSSPAYPRRAPSRSSVCLLLRPSLGLVAVSCGFASFRSSPRLACRKTGRWLRRLRFVVAPVACLAAGVLVRLSPAPSCLGLLTGCCCGVPRSAVAVLFVVAVCSFRYALSPRSVVSRVGAGGVGSSWGLACLSSSCGSWSRLLLAMWSAVSVCLLPPPPCGSLFHRLWRAFSFLPACRFLFAHIVSWRWRGLFLLRSCLPRVLLSPPLVRSLLPCFVDRPDGRDGMAAGVWSCGCSLAGSVSGGGRGFASWCGGGRVAVWAACVPSAVGAARVARVAPGPVACLPLVICPRAWTWCCYGVRLLLTASRLFPAGRSRSVSPCFPGSFFSPLVPLFAISWAMRGSLVSPFPVPSVSPVAPHGRQGETGRDAAVWLVPLACLLTRGRLGEAGGAACFINPSGAVVGDVPRGVLGLAHPASVSSLVPRFACRCPFFFPFLFFLSPCPLVACPSAVCLLSDVPPPAGSGDARVAVVGLLRLRAGW